MASAFGSLLVPVSPLIKTVALVGATTCTRPSTSRRATLLPTMQGSPLPNSSLPSDDTSSISKDAVWSAASASLTQLVCAAILYSFPSFNREHPRTQAAANSTTQKSSVHMKIAVPLRSSNPFRQDPDR